MDFTSKFLSFLQFLFSNKYFKAILNANCRAPVEKRSRSRVTIPFRIYKDGKPDEALEKAFLSEAEKKHLLKELKGHRSVGGIRAAIFNAISYEEIEKLVGFMKDFQTCN